MNIFPAQAALAYSIPNSFFPVGGVGPFTFSVLPGGAGGTIDVNGVYTAPASLPLDVDGNQISTDTVRVTDSLADFADAIVKVGDALTLVCDIIQTEMGLADGRVYLWDQKIPEPTDSDIFVVLQVLTAKPFANVKKYITSGAGVQEEQSINMMATCSLDIKSRGNGAVDRKEEILMALKSDYAQNQMELNSFYIASLPSNFVNLSNIDGAAIPYRFNISINVQYSKTKTKAVPYYDTFLDPAVTTDP